MKVTDISIDVDSFKADVTEKKRQSYFTTGGYRQSVRLGDKPLETHDQ
jgi:hypothetical protein